MAKDGAVSSGAAPPLTEIVRINIRRYMNVSDLTEADLALRMEVPASHVTRILAGRLDPRLNELPAFAHALRVGVHELVTEKPQGRRGR